MHIIKTIAGNGNVTSNGDGFAAASAGIPVPRDVALDASGTLYISSAGRIRRVMLNGTIDTFVTIPDPTTGGTGLGGLTWTTGIAAYNGNLFVAQNSAIGSRILLVSPQGNATVLLGSGTLRFNFGEFVDLVRDRAGNIYIADSANHRIVRRSLEGAVSVYAGRTGVDAFGGDGGPASSASLNTPTGLAIDSAGNLYIADTGNHRIRRVDSAGTIMTYAGFGGPDGGFTGDGGPAINARLNSPRGIAVDSLDNIFFADSANSRIRRVDRSGTISTVAGSGSRADCFSSECYSGDNGNALAAQLSRGIEGLAIDREDNLYIADTGNHRIRKVTFNVPAHELPPPAIRSSGGIGVWSGATFQSQISSGSWAVIFGQSLAPVSASGRTWRAEEIVDGNLPTSLDGVSVRLNGRSAYPYFISPTQLNVLVPDGLPLGAVPVEVETPSGTARTNANVRTFAPDLFGTGTGRLGTIYAAAIHRDGTIVGDPSLIPGSRPAKAGDRISLYGTGFGATSPVRPVGSLFDPAPLLSMYTVRVNGARAQSSFGGIVSPGLYQFDIIVPSVSASIAYVEIEVGGQRTDSRMILAISQ